MRASRPAERVPVLLQEASSVVAHRPRVVPDAELERGAPRGAEVRVRPEQRTELVAQREVGRPRHGNLVLQDREEPMGDALKEVQTALVVLERDAAPVDILRLVLPLLLLEQVAGEELLQLLVGKVDAELLEAVGFEALEPENVQDRDARRRATVVVHRVQARVDAVDEEAEQRRVEGHAQRVAGVLGLGRGQRLRHRIPPCRDEAGRQSPPERILGHPEELGRVNQRVLGSSVA